MRIPYRDSRSGMKRRWTDFHGMAKQRFVDLFEAIERCNEIDKDGWRKLRELVESKIQAGERPPAGSIRRASTEI